MIIRPVDYIKVVIISQSRSRGYVYFIYCFLEIKTLVGKNWRTNNSEEKRLEHVDLQALLKIDLFYLFFGSEYMENRSKLLITRQFGESKFSQLFFESVI